MNWDAIGAIGEIVGAIAVVATLAYLATQIRYARLAASDASRQARADGVREMELTYINNIEFRQAWDKAEGSETSELMNVVADQLGVTVSEANLVMRGAACWSWMHWAQWRSIKTEEDEGELENIVREFYRSKPMRTLWEHHPWFTTRLDPDFVSWVQKVAFKEEATDDA